MHKSLCYFMQKQDKFWSLLWWNMPKMLLPFLDFRGMLSVVSLYTRGVYPRAIPRRVLYEEF